MNEADLEILLVRVLTKHTERIVEKAAEVGARKALAAVGLHDEHAADDVRDLRNHLAAMRAAKRLAGKLVGGAGKVVFVQALKIVSAIAVLALLAWFGIKPHLPDLP